MRRWCSMVVVLLATLPETGSTQASWHSEPPGCPGAVLLKDVACGTSGSDPRAFTVVGSQAFFTAQDAGHGRELWVTDGTAAGTRFVKDITPGAEGSEPGSLVSLHGLLFFTVGNVFSRQALWRSDGTAEGTFPIQEVPPPGDFGSFQNLTVFQEALFFTSSDPLHGRELWRSDGTAAGTALFKDIFPGSRGSEARAPTVAGPWLYFLVPRPPVDTDFHRPELWRTDGTAEGTHAVAAAFPASGDTAPQLESFTAVGAQLFFTVTLRDSDDSMYQGLWRSDGTASGTLELKVVRRPPDQEVWGNLSSLTAVGNTLFFSAFEPTTGQELWKSDGTLGGTVLVEDLHPGPESSSPTQLTAVGSRLYFSAYEPVHGLELWRSDGTPQGTALVEDIARGAQGASPSFLKEVEGRLFFTANAGPRGFEPWRSDGSGAQRLRVLCQGALSSSPHEFVALGTKLLFAANGRKVGTEPWAVARECVGVQSPEQPLELEGECVGHCRSPVSLVQDIAPGRQGAFGFGQAKLGSRLYFQAIEPGTGSELWSTDGTASGTHLVKDLTPGPRDSNIADLTVAGGTLYFTVSDAVRGRALWKSDGTARGTLPVAGTPEDFVRTLNAVGRYLYFTTPSGLWRTDGTAVGTLRLTSTPAEPLESIRDTLYFTRFSPADQAGLWRTDGTLAGTIRVSPLFVIARALNVGGRLFLAAEDDAHGLELWTSDGTEAGTRRVKDIQPGPAGSLQFMDGLTAVGGKLFFFADDGVHGREPWVSDGTEAGTHLVKDLFPGAQGADFVELVGGGRLAFFRILRFGERELLWRSDGREAGTFELACTDAVGLTLIDGVLFFTGDDYTGAGSEPWRSDGTRVGTRRLQDLAPGVAYTSAYGFTRLGSRVVFFADDGGTGLEPWSVPYSSRGDGSPPPSLTCPVIPP